MQFFTTLTTSLLFLGNALATTGDVVVHVVAVSSAAQNTLKFSPNNVIAKPGEMVQFQFHNGNHTITQSTFAQPCIPINNVMSNVTGFFSGFQAVKMGAASIPTYTVMVNDMKPLWYYCSQGKHCQAGMVGAINAPTSGAKTVDAFAALAAQAAQNLAPGMPSMGGSAAGSGSGSGSGSASASGGLVAGSGSGAGAAATASVGTDSGSTGSTTTTGGTAVSTGAASHIFAGTQEVLTGVSVAALLSALLL